MVLLFLPFLCFPQPFYKMRKKTYSIKTKTKKGGKAEVKIQDINRAQTKKSHFSSFFCCNFAAMIILIVAVFVATATATATAATATVAVAVTYLKFLEYCC